MVETYPPILHKLVCFSFQVIMTTAIRDSGNLIIALRIFLLKK